MISYRGNGPQRIVCLTEETTETLYLLGEEERIVGISGFTCRPKQAREKPKVSAFTSAKIDKILALRPDLVIGFSDLQAGIAQELIKAGVNVVVFNQRSIAEIFETILMVARMVAAEAAGMRLADRLRNELAEIADAAARFPRRPRVFFEEWTDPLISGIRWVDELLEVAGGEALFPRLREEQVRHRPDRHARAGSGGESGRGDRFLVRKEGQQGADSAARETGPRSRRFVAIASTRSSRRTSCNPVPRH